jgi:hypothetical protein
MGSKLLDFVSFEILNQIKTIVGAGAALRYGSGSDQMIQLRFRNTALREDTMLNHPCKKFQN